MGWLSLVITLLLEQLRPLPRSNPVYSAVRQVSGWAERNLNAGRRRHGVYAWLLVVIGLALVVGAAYAVASSISPILGLVVNVAVLFVSLGFRQFSHHGTEIQIALANGDLLTLKPRVLALNNVAWLMAQQRQPGALALAEKANQLAPNQPALMDTLAYVLALEKQPQRAVELQKKAMAQAPQNDSLRLTLAKIYLENGDKANARAELDTLAKLGDKFGAQPEVKRLLATL